MRVWQQSTAQVEEAILLPRLFSEEPTKSCESCLPEALGPEARGVGIF
jgi:hypothetical protein